MSGAGTAVKSAAGDVWQAFGTRLLAFHYQTPLTYMCRCGETLVSCSVLATARDLKLLPPLPRPESESAAKEAVARRRAELTKGRAGRPTLPTRRGSFDRRL